MTTKRRKTEQVSGLEKSDVNQAVATLAVEVLPDSDRTQHYVEKLRVGKSFLNLVLLNVATGVYQHRSGRSSNATSENSLEVTSVYSEAEKNGAFRKQVISRLEKIFKAVIKETAFWEQKAIWVITHLDRWQAEGRVPPACAIPGLLLIQSAEGSEEKSQRELLVISACAFYTASEWLSHLDLANLSVEEMEKLLGLRPTNTFASNAPKFHGHDLERVATGYPILTGAQALINNQWEDGEYPYWKKLVGEGFIQHNIVRQSPSTQQIELVPGKAAWEIIQQFGPEAAYVLLIFSSYATDSEQPWEQQIRIKGTDLIKLFGWDRRTDIALGQKLKKIGNLVELVCSLSVLVNNINIGTSRYNIARGPMWLLEELEYSGQLGLTMEANRPGSLRYEAGDPDELYIKIRPGSWTEKFLNGKSTNGKDALCQYGYLAKSTLQINPYRQRLASKLAIFLTIMSRIRRDGRYEIGTLLERLEPKELMTEIQESKQRRNALATQWDNALLTLHELGWQIEFDPETYPECIRPAWSVEGDDAQLKARPRNWLPMWLKAIVIIRPTALIQEKIGAVRSPVDKQKSNFLIPPAPEPESYQPLTGSELMAALDAKGWTRSQLAKSLGVDRSLITRWVNSERAIPAKHQPQIRVLLEI